MPMHGFVSSRHAAACGGPVPVGPRAFYSALLAGLLSIPLVFAAVPGAWAQEAALSASAFADRVVAYEIGRIGGTMPVETETDPRAALGAPDYSGPADGLTTSLGCGGMLVLEFVDNRLVNVPGPDLIIHEAGRREAVRVEISPDGTEWFDLGRAAGGRREIDIEGAVPADAAFRFVRLIDLESYCAGRWPGADIDAVEAVGLAAAPALQDGGTLTAIDESGTVLPRLEPRVPFRIQAEWDTPPVGAAPTAALLWQGGNATVSLTPAETPGVYESGWLAIVAPGDPRPGDYYDLFAGSADREASLRLSADYAARELAGGWRVISEGPNATLLEGYAQVAGDGGAARMTIADARGGDAVYESIETSFGPSINIVRMVPQAAADAARRWFAVVREREPQGLEFSSDASLLSVTAEELEAAFTVAPPERLVVYRASLHHERPGLLDGEWFTENTAEGLAFSLARTIAWSRDSEIHGIVALPPAVTARPDEHLVQYRLAKEWAKPQRTLFVYGKNLPVTGPAIFENLPEGVIEYRRRADVTDEAAAWQTAGIERSEGLDAIRVEATLRPDAPLGETPMTLNGVTGNWILDNMRVPAYIGFVAPFGTASPSAQLSAAPYDSVTGAETMVLDIDLMAPLLAAEIGVALRLDEEPAPYLVSYGDVFAQPANGLLAAARNPDSPEIEYRSPPIRLMRTDHAGFGPPPAENDGPSLVVALAQGQTLAAFTDPQRILTIPLQATVAVAGDPSQIAGLWESALQRVAACTLGRLADDLEEFQLLPSPTRESHFLITDRGERSVEFTNADHAAAILIRDEIVRELDRLLPLYAERAAADLETIDAFRRALLDSVVPEDDLFWQVAKVTLPDSGVEIPLIRTLDLAAEAETLGANRGTVWGMTADEARWWAAEQTRAAYDRLVGDMETSIRRANALGDCDLVEMLVIAGQRADPVVAALLPRLVKQQSENNTRYLVPDRFAQGAVAGLAGVGESVRALQQLADIDDAYKSMALALTGTATSFAFAQAAGALGRAAIEATRWSERALRTAQAARAALTGAAWGAQIGADAADIYMSYEQYQEALERNSLIDFARGAAPAIGAGWLDEAEAAKQSEFWAALGVVAPAALGALPVGVRTAQGAARLVDLLRESGAVGRGAALAAEGLDEARLAALADSERSDLAAYYLSLRQSANSGGGLGGGLGAAEEASLARLEEAARTGSLGSIDDQLGTGVFALAGDAGQGTATLPWSPDTAGMFPGPQPAAGRLAGQVFDIETAAGDRLVFELGDFVGAGSFNEVYRNPSPLLGDFPADTLFRVSRDTPGGVDASELDRIGRAALTEADAAFVRAPEVIARFEVTDAAGVPRVIEVVENVGVSASARVGRGADGILQPLSPGQAIAFDQATRELNRNGYAWLDNHPGNWALRPIDEAKDEWEVVIFDPGGIIPAVPRGVPGATADPALARQIQLHTNAPAQVGLEGVADIAQFGHWARGFAWEALRDNVDLSRFGLGEEVLDLEGKELWAAMNQAVPLYPNAATRQPGIQGLFAYSDEEVAAIYNHYRRTGTLPPR